MFAKKPSNARVKQPISTAVAAATVEAIMPCIRCQRETDLYSEVQTARR